MGMMQVGMGAGVAMGPMIGGAVADAFGYRPAFYVTALLLFLAGLTVLFWVKEPNNHNQAAATQAHPPAQKRGIIAGWKDIFCCPGVPAVYSLSFLNNLCRNMLLPVVPLFIPMLMQGAALVNTFTGLVTGMSSATTTLSGVFLGRLGDRIGQRRVLIASLVAASGLFAVQSGVRDAWQLLILQAIVGIAMGGITPSISALLARFTPPGREGAVYGLDNSIGSGARSLAPMIGSAVMVWWGVRSTFVVSGALLALTAVFAALALPGRVDRERDRLAG